MDYVSGPRFTKGSRLYRTMDINRSSMAICVSVHRYIHTAGLIATISETGLCCLIHVSWTLIKDTVILLTL